MDRNVEPDLLSLMSGMGRGRLWPAGEWRSRSTLAPEIPVRLGTHVLCQTDLIFCESHGVFEEHRRKRVSCTKLIKHAYTNAPRLQSRRPVPYLLSIYRQ
jgi:hypothetical protein